MLVLRDLCLHTVLEATSSGEHKVKLQGVIVSEESGSNGAILSDHAGVFDRVSDAVTGHTDGFYHSTVSQGVG